MFLENWAQGKRPLTELWKAYNKEVDRAKQNSCPTDYKKTYEEGQEGSQEGQEGSGLAI